MIIYKITNNVNNKIYIGLTTQTINRRVASYRSVSRTEKYNRPQRIIQAMRKHGFDNFVFEIIEKVGDREELKKREIYWVAFFKSNNPTIGYNADFGGFLQSKETIEKRTEILRNRKQSPESNLKRSKTLMGHKVSDETRAKQSKARMGKKAWNKGTKGLMKCNNGFFVKGMVAPNKGRKRVIIDGKIRYIKGNTWDTCR